METRLMIIYDADGIINASEFVEGTGLYMTLERCVIIAQKDAAITMLTAIGITDFSSLENY